MSNYTGIPTEDKKTIDNDLDFAPSTLETVDYAIYDYINENLDLKTLTNEGRKKVPVILGRLLKDPFRSRITKSIETKKVS